MKTVTFSIIIPTFNRAATLALSVDSALSLSGDDFEIIVVDDGSTDDTKSVAEAFGDQITYIHQDNSGAAAARNHGARVARGDWLCFLDSDDRYYANRLDCVRDALQAFPDADCVLANSAVTRNGVEEADNYQKSTMPAYEEATGVNLPRFFPLTTAIKEEFAYYQFVHTNSMTMKKALFEACDGFPEQLKIGEDSLLWVSAVAIAKMPVATKDIVSLYAAQDGSLFQPGSLENNHLAVLATQTFLERPKRFHPPEIVSGAKRRISQSRYDYGVALLRAGKRGAAWKQAFKLFFENPGKRPFRMMMSILMG